MPRSSGARHPGRLADWVPRLADYLAEREAQAFAWGGHDCARFACGGIAAMTGRDPAPQLAGYGSRAEAEQALAAAGYADLDAAARALAARAGFPAVAPGHAQRGDLVLIQAPQGLFLGLIDLDGRHLAMAAKPGVARLAPWRWRRFALAAWRV